MSGPAIMVVEDETIVALDMKNRLQQLGYRVVGRAVSGTEAIQYASYLQPDLILMDVRIQGDLDGIETAERIRSRHDIPIIYLTAYSDEETLKRAKITEPYGYLIKPFEERELHTIIEMTLHKHAMERKLRQQSNRLQAIVDTVPEGIVMLNAENEIVLANSLGLDYLEVIAERDPETVLRAIGQHTLDKLFASAGIWHDIETDDAEKRAFVVTAKPVASDPNVGGWVIIMHDVSERQEMLRRVQQHTHLAAIGQLAAGIAHDFNNILTVLSFGDKVVLMTHPELSAHGRECLENNLRQIERASQLVKQVLDFSRRLPLEPIMVDLLPLIKETAKMLERTLPENIELTVQHELSTCILLADPGRIQQVVTNLVLNARDALPSGGAIRISLNSLTLHADDTPPVAEMSPGRWIHLAVADNGTGIPVQILPRIFEPFFTTKRQGQGTGLGLAQVYGIVRNHEGFITVDTREDMGTTFDIYLPSVEPQGDEREQGL